jgi:hypothetical protein
MPKIPNHKQHEATMRSAHGSPNSFPREMFNTSDKNHQQDEELRGGDVSIEALLELRAWLENVGQNKQPSLAHPPGFRLVEFLGNFCQKATLEGRLKPLHAEYLAWHFEALKEKQYRKAAWLKFQMRFYLIYTVLDDFRTIFRGR